MPRGLCGESTLQAEYFNRTCNKLFSLRVRHLKIHSADPHHYTIKVLYPLTQIGSMEFWMSSLRGFTLALMRANKLLNTGQTNMARSVTITQLLTTWRQLSSQQQPAVRLQSAEANLNCFVRGMLLMQQSSGTMVSAQPLTTSSCPSMYIVYLSLQGDIQHCN